MIDAEFPPGASREPQPGWCAMRRVTYSPEDATWTAGDVVYYLPPNHPQIQAWERLWARLLTLPTEKRDDTSAAPPP
jgi:hypothetical protein